MKLREHIFDLPLLVEVFIPAPSPDIKSPKILRGDNVKPRINYDRAWQDFTEDGYWWEDCLEYIPIDQIDIPEVWNQHRYDNNKQWLEKTGKFPPIRAWFDDEKKMYGIGDGIHRVNVAKDLGYTHIPALVGRKRTTKPPFNPVEMEKMKYVLNNVANESDKFFPNGVCFASERYNIDENSIKAIMDVIDLEKEKDVFFFIVRYDQKENHSVSFVDEDKNTIDEIVFESDKAEFEEIALEKIKMLCERNREMLE
jgi:hypothetical protein